MVLLLWVCTFLAGYRCRNSSATSRKRRLVPRSSHFTYHTHNTHTQHIHTLQSHWTVGGAVISPGYRFDVGCVQEQEKALASLNAASTAAKNRIGGEKRQSSRRVSSAVNSKSPTRGVGSSSGAGAGSSDVANRLVLKLDPVDGGA